MHHREKGCQLKRVARVNCKLCSNLKDVTRQKMCSSDFRKHGKLAGSSPINRCTIRSEGTSISPKATSQWHRVPCENKRLFQTVSYNPEPAHWSGATRREDLNFFSGLSASWLERWLRKQKTKKRQMPANSLPPSCFVVLMWSQVLTPDTRG